MFTKREVTFADDISRVDNILVNLLFPSSFLNRSVRMFEAHRHLPCRNILRIGRCLRLRAVLPGKKLFVVALSGQDISS